MTPCRPRSTLRGCHGTLPDGCHVVDDGYGDGAGRRCVCAAKPCNAARKDQQDIMRRIKQPALVMCGDYNGQYSVRRHEFLAELIPYAQLEVIPNAGHIPTLENPDAVTNAIRRRMRQPLVLR